MFSEKNLPRLIIATPIIAIIIITVVLSLSFIKLQRDYLIQETYTLEHEYMERQKEILKKEVNGIFTYIDYQRNLLIQNSKKNIKIEMQNFMQNLPKSNIFYDNYIIQNTNSITDFVIFDLARDTVYKQSDLFFHFENQQDFQKILKNDNETFWLQDETNLYYFFHDQQKNSYILLSKTYTIN